MLAARLHVDSEVTMNQWGVFVMAVALAFGEIRSPQPKPLAVLAVRIDEERIDRYVAERKAQEAANGTIKRKQGRIIPWIFHRRGEPIGQIQKNWNKATAAAGLKGRIPHDLRRTAVRNLERAGVPSSAAMKLVGHKTESICRRYAITDEAMLQEAGAKLSPSTGICMSKSRQSQRVRRQPRNSRKVPQMRRLSWRRRPDLNRRVEVLQTSALTTWLRRPERSTIEERRRSIKIRREATRPGASCLAAARAEQRRSARVLPG